MAISGAPNTIGTVTGSELKLSPFAKLQSPTITSARPDRVPICVDIVVGLNSFEDNLGALVVAVHFHP